MSEKDKFLNWIREKQKKGLLDIHFTSAMEGTAMIFRSRNATEEDLYAELNRMHEAPTVSDTEVLGPRSP